MEIKRRSLIMALLGGAAAGAAGVRLLDGSAEPDKAEGPSVAGNAAAPQASLDATIIAVGLQGNRRGDVITMKLASANRLDPSYRINHSVLNEISLKTGNIKTTTLPMSKAHSAARLPDGSIFAVSHHGDESLLLDPDHKVMKSFIVPAGQLYGGHALVLKEKGVVIAPTRAIHAVTKKDSGMLLVYDLKSMKLVDQIKSGGIHPHELRVLPGGKELAITHYGDVDTKHPQKLELHVIAPMLTIHKLDNLEKVREYLQPIDAIYTHMDLGHQGDVYAVSNQYITTNETVASEKAIRAAMQEHGINHDFDRSVASMDEKRIAVPSGLIKVNPQTGAREELMAHKNHLRSQSVAANNLAKKVFATYVYSNELLVHDEATNTTSAVEMHPYGINAVRGVCSLPGSPYIAVADQDRGMVVIDARDMKQVASHDVFLFNTSHLFIG